MNKSVFILFFAFITLISCDTDSILGSKKIIHKSYAYSDFTKIDASETYSIKLTQGKEFKVDLSCNENILEFIEIELKGKTLVLDFKGNHTFSDITAKVNITVPTIKEIEASGASKIKMNGFTLDELAIDVSGASSFKGNLKIKGTIDIEASGASTVKIKGSAKDGNLDLSGASTLKAKEFTVLNELTVDASGASSCEITAKGTLELESSGASSIGYYGKGKVLKSETSGAGRIEKKYKV